MESKKNRGSTAIVVIVFFAILALAIFGIVMLVRAKKYDPGTVDKATLTYTNKWAKVKIKAPDGFTVTEKSDDDTSITMFSRVNGTKASIIGVCADSSTTEVDSGLNYMRSQLSSLGVSNAGFGITLKPFTNTMIADKSYKVLPIEMKGGGVTVYANFYGRVVHNNGVIIFFTVSMSPAETDELLRMISEY